ncbi:hypothetical protein DL89DRAFT_323740 [Linderina pennispora]|uniref:Uncharacterized protein n=1 Tax=Linderina pennispora TaxID=61395 RepID=A0A1Y1W3M4_9FUNG|nr:uncharacterized protein DL89DRAFT_323740 [Linderina pennispora]ORX68143.1 hypothetical protein DL89DRAFT_323740 [Linderina pennispora]
MRVHVFTFAVLAQLASAHPVADPQLLGPMNRGLVNSLVDALLGPNALNVDLCLDLKLGDGPQSLYPSCPNYVAPVLPPPPPYPPMFKRDGETHKLTERGLGVVNSLVDALLGPNALNADVCLNLKLGDGPQSLYPSCPNYVTPIGPPPYPLFKRDPQAPLPPPPILHRSKGLVGGLLELLLGPNALNLDLCLDLKLGDGPQSLYPACPGYVPPVIPPPPAAPYNEMPPPPAVPPPAAPEAVPPPPPPPVIPPPIPAPPLPPRIATAATAASHRS